MTYSYLSMRQLQNTVLHHAWATVEVLHIIHLDRIPVVCDVVPARRLKIARKTGDPSRALHVGDRAAWKHYLRGNVLSELQPRSVVIDKLRKNQTDELTYIDNC